MCVFVTFLQTKCSELWGGGGWAPCVRFYHLSTLVGPLCDSFATIYRDARVVVITVILELLESQNN